MVCAERTFAPGNWSCARASQDCAADAAFCPKVAHESKTVPSATRTSFSMTNSPDVGDKCILAEAHVSPSRNSDAILFVSAARFPPSRKGLHRSFDLG